METKFAENVGQKAETSFDVLASVDLYKFDIASAGYIRAETRQRVYDEELSYLAEGINRPNFNSFVLTQRNGELVIFQNGEWQSYISTLLNGLSAAKTEASQDYRRQFEVDRRVDDLARGYQIQKLQPGEKMNWHYDFPDEQLKRYGQNFLESMGYQPNRRMGYFCEAERTHDGDIIICHQSIDNWDAQGAAAAERQELSIEGRRQAYDDYMLGRTGRPHYAGRDLAANDREANAWDIVRQHKDLIEDYFLKNIEALAYQNLPRAQLEEAKKRLTYGVWAALKERLDKDVQFGHQAGAAYGDISMEVSQAYSELSARGEVLFGCGGAISGEKALLSVSPKGVFESIFGAKMNCPFCGAAQYGDPCSPNQYCPTCQARVRSGKLVSRGKGRAPKKGFIDLLMEELEVFNRKFELEREIKKQRAKSDIEDEAPPGSVKILV